MIFALTVTALGEKGSGQAGRWAGQGGDSSSAVSPLFCGLGADGQRLRAPGLRLALVRSLGPTSGRAAPYERGDAEGALTGGWGLAADAPVGFQGAESCASSKQEETLRRRGFFPPARP